MKTVFIISGIGGMTGSQLALELAKRTDCTIVGFDNGFNCDIEAKRKQLNKINIEAFLGSAYDINSNDFLKKLESTIDQERSSYEEVVFINCAAVVHTKHFYVPSETFDTNVNAMRNFLEIAIRVGAKTFINCSTSEVYSSESYVEGGVKEDAILKMYTAEHSQRTSYAFGKLMTEFFLKEAVNNGCIKGASLRFANVYATDETEPEHIIPKIIYDTLNGKIVKLCENAKHTRRTFLNNVDSCNAVIHLIDNEQFLDGSAYNVGTETEYTIEELCQLVESVFNEEDDNYYVDYEFSQPARSADPERRLLNCEKLMKTGWKPQISLRAGIRDMVHFAINYVDECERKAEEQAHGAASMPGGIPGMFAGMIGQGMEHVATNPMDIE